MNKNKGFTLVELMVVLAIISILAAVVVPSYQSQVQRSVRGDGMSTLLDMMRAQENFFANDYTYTTDLTELNYTDPFVTDGGDYRITASQCDDGSALTACVKLTATALRNQASDGNLTIDSRGNKTHDGNTKWMK